MWGFHGRVGRHGRDALLRGGHRGRSVAVRGRESGEGGVFRFGSPGIDPGEIVPDSEEEEGYEIVPDSEEEEGYDDVPDSKEDGCYADVLDSKDEKFHAEVPDSEDAGDVPEAIARSLDVMEEQYRDVALSIYRICFSSFFKRK